MTRKFDSVSPRCAWCGLPIEACDGAHSDWMHSLTRSERCAAGGRLAEPETAAGLVNRVNTVLNSQRQTRRGRR